MNLPNVPQIINPLLKVGRQIFNQNQHSGMGRRTIGLLLMTILPIICYCGYSSSAALELAFMSSIAYDTKANIENWSCADCKRYQIQHQKYIYNTVANIQAFAGYLPNINAIVVAFRGSADLKNWIADLSTSSVVYPGCANCHVHYGFNKAYNGVGPDVRSAVQGLRALYRSAPLVITGHSLGGAMAILAALDLHDLSYPIKEVYTFGQPRVGDAAFSTNYQNKFPETYRLIHYADMVPHLPPSNFGFIHGGHEVWYSQDMSSHQICAPESLTCANSIPAYKLNTGDHSLAYYTKLTAIQDNEESASYPYTPNDIAESFIHSVESQEQLKAVEEEVARIRAEENSKPLAQLQKFLRRIY